MHHLAWAAEAACALLSSITLVIIVASTFLSVSSLQMFCRCEFLCVNVE